MPQIGIQDLRIHTAEIMRRVRDERTHYIITYRGQPVGLLLPLQEAKGKELLRDESPGIDPWEELTELGQEIGAGWLANQTSTEILSDMRR